MEPKSRTAERIEERIVTQRERDDSDIIAEWDSEVSACY
jgi:hypothetical protein